MTTSPRRTLASLLLLSLGIASADAVTPRVDTGSQPALQMAEAPPPGGGVLDPYLQAPPPTAEDVLVERLALLGAERDAAWLVVGDLAPWQGRLDPQASAADLARSAAATLRLEGRALDKAARLAAAYLDGRPVSLEGIEIPSELRGRIEQLRAQGLGGEVAAWLARQELAAAQSGGEPVQRLDASLELLALADELRGRVSQVFRGDALEPRSADLDSDGLVRLDRRQDREPGPALTPSAACVSCPNYTFGTFIPTQNWATHAASIGANDCKVYRFSLTAGKTYRFTFCEGGGSATFNARIESSSFQGNVCAVGPNGVICGGTLHQLDYTAPYTGFFFVKVRNIDLVAGTYRIAFRDITPRCVSCPAYDFGPFTPTAAAWATQSSSIGPLECRIYRFTVVANRRYRFTLCPTDSDGDPTTGASSSFAANLTARNAACAPIGGPAPAPCNPGEEIDVTPSAGGTIYVRVAGDGLNDFGSYTLAYRDISPCASCPSQDFGPFTPSAAAYATHSSSIGTNKCKLYRFNVTAGRTYRFVTCDPDTAGDPTGAGATFDTVLEAFNSGCAFLAFNDDSCASFDSQLDVTPTYTGAMFVRMSGFAGAGGNYTLAYREIPTLCRPCPAFDAAPANPTLAYQTVAGSIDRDGCYNLRFFLTAGNGYRFVLCPQDSDAMPTGASTSFPHPAPDDPVLDLRSSTCVLLASDDNSCGSGGLVPELDFTPGSTGFYYLRVRGGSIFDYGDFTLAYRQITGICLNCPSFDHGPFTPSAAWATHASSIAPAACRVYRFQLTAGREYEFSLCEGGGSTTFPAVLAGDDPSCAAIGSIGGQCMSATEDLSIVAATTGLHYVTVSGAAPADNGSFVLAWRDRSAACLASCANGTFNWGPFTPSAAVNFHADTLEANCRKTYLFQVTAGSAYHFWTCPPGSASFDSALAAEAAPGCGAVGIVANNACGDDAMLDWLATSTGQIYVTVSDEGAIGGAYSLAYWAESCSPAYFEDFQANDGGWTHQSLGGEDSWSRRQVACDGSNVGSPTFMTDSNSCNANLQYSKAISPAILLPTWPSLALDLDAIAVDEHGFCLAFGGFDRKDVGISTDGGMSWTTLNACFPLTSSNGVWQHHVFDISGFAGLTINIVVAYDTVDAAGFPNYYFAFDNVAITCGP